MSEVKPYHVIPFCITFDKLIILLKFHSSSQDEIGKLSKQESYTFSTVASASPVDGPEQVTV